MLIVATVVAFATWVDGGGHYYELKCLLRLCSLAVAKRANLRDMCCLLRRKFAFSDDL